jgi:DNA-binding CsgD family transcriptional regulator
MVGRRTELTVLEAALDDAMAGRGSVTVISGEAGIGKSRLAYEIQARAASLGMQVLVGRAVHAGAHMPFRPLAEAFHSVLRHKGGLSNEEMEPFQAALGRLASGSTGSPFGADHVAGVVPEAVVRLLRALSKAQGLLLVLEDLHWADADTLAVIEYMADSLEAERVLLICTERSDWAGRGAEVLGDLVSRRSASRLVLRALSEEAVEEMANLVLGVESVPAAIVGALRYRAGGVPFLIEEMLAAYVSAAGSTVRSTEWWISRRIADSLPSSYRDLVRARLANLDEESRRVIYAAAVLGRTFEWPLLSPVTDIDKQSVLNALALAVKENLIGAAGGSRGTAFSFRHAIARESVLADLLPPDLAALSAKAADVIEDTYPGLPGDWCEHAADLRIQAGDHLGACRLLQESGRRSFARGALATAESALVRARELVEGDSMAWLGADELLLQVLSVAGKPQRLVELGQRVLERLGRYFLINPGTINGSRLAQLHLRLARGAMLSDDLKIAVEHLANARNEVPADAAQSLLLEVDALDVELALAMNDIATVQARAGATERAAAGLGRFELSCRMLEAQGRAAFFSGDSDGAQLAFERMEATARTAGLALQRVRSLTELGTLSGLAVGDTTQLEEARRLAVDTGAVSTLTRIDLEIAWIKWGLAETGEAAGALERALDISRLFGLRSLPMTLIAQSSLHALAGKRLLMEHAIAQALDLGPNDTQVNAGLHGNGRAVINLLEGNREAASAELATAVEILNKEAGRPWWFQGLSALLETLRGADGNGHLPASALGDPANRAFQRYAQAVDSGRDGDHAEAERAFALGDALMPPGWRRHYARVLVAEAAIEDGWGEPGQWASEALANFQDLEIGGLATYAKAVMRRAGVPVPRRKREADVPIPLQSLGVTGREMEVLRLVALGLSNQEIGQRLFLSPRTVESHVTSLMRKTQNESRPQLVAFAGRHSA